MNEDLKIVVEEIKQLSKEVQVEKGSLGTISKVVPFFTAAVTIFIAIFSWYTSHDLEELKKKVDIEHTRISDRQGDAAMGANLHRDVFTVLGEKEPNEKRKSNMLELLHAVEAEYRDDEEKQSMREFLKHLESLFEADPALKDTAAFYVDDANIPFRSSMDSGASDEVSVGRANAPTFTSKETGTRSSPGATRGWDYDLFWCEGDRNLQLAEVIFNGLRDRQASEKLGKLRLRKLPNSVRESAGYEIGNQIVIRRHASKDNQAQALKNDVASILKARGLDIQVDIQESAQRLPFYLSVFICL